MRTVDPASAVPRILGVPLRPPGEAGSVLVNCGADGATRYFCSSQMPPGPPICFATFLQKDTFSGSPESTGVALMSSHSPAIAPDPARPAANGAPERGFLVPPELPAVVRVRGDGSAKTLHFSFWNDSPGAVSVPPATPLRLSAPVAW